MLWSWSQFLQASNNSPLGLLTVLLLHLFSSPALQWMSTLFCTPLNHASSSPPLISADFNQVPDTVLYDWYSYNWMSTVLTLEPSSSWVVRATELELEGSEFSSHLELEIFSQLSGRRILLLPKYIVSNTYSYTLSPSLSSPVFSSCPLFA